MGVEDEPRPVVAGNEFPCDVATGRFRVAVALQGGGSHGAFTWGVLDRLLLESDLNIVGISGTSAGAMNAAVLADGLRRGGPSAAKAALTSYWQDVGRLPGYACFQALTLPGAPRSWHLDNNPVSLWMDMLARIWSPDQVYRVQRQDFSDRQIAGAGNQSALGKPLLRRWRLEQRRHCAGF